SVPPLFPAECAASVLSGCARCRSGAGAQGVFPGRSPYRGICSEPPATFEARCGEFRRRGGEHASTGSKRMSRHGPLLTQEFLVFSAAFSVNPSHRTRLIRPAPGGSLKGT